jgi:hypothetical protein
MKETAKAPRTPRVPALKTQPADDTIAECFPPLIAVIRQ